jgi:hypothetical protein
VGVSQSSKSGLQAIGQNVLFVSISTYVGMPVTPSGAAPARHWFVAHHQKRISGPLLDRIGIHVDVPSVNAPTAPVSARLAQRG